MPMINSMRSTYYVTRDMKIRPDLATSGGLFQDNLIVPCCLSLYHIARQRLKFLLKRKNEVRKFRCISTLTFLTICSCFEWLEKIANELSNLVDHMDCGKP